MSVISGYTFLTKKRNWKNHVCSSVVKPWWIISEQEGKGSVLTHSEPSVKAVHCFCWDSLTVLKNSLLPAFFIFHWKQYTRRCQNHHSSQMRRLSVGKKHRYRTLTKFKDTAPTAPSRAWCLARLGREKMFWGHFSRILFKHTFSGADLNFTRRSALFWMNINFPVTFMWLDTHGTQGLHVFTREPCSFSSGCIMGRVVRRGSVAFQAFLCRHRTGHPHKAWFRE